MKKHLANFEDYEIQRHYDEETKTWFFSVIDIIQVLIMQADYQATRNYWNKRKKRIKKEGSESVKNFLRLKLEANDGKKYLTDVANAETLLRLIQSIPSPKAEPIKLWLARVGYERMQEMADPEKSVDRARETWRRYGCSEKWIEQRMMGEEASDKFTDDPKEHELSQADEFAMLAKIIHQEWTGTRIKGRKDSKGLKSENFRDYMSAAELIFTALAEFSTRQIPEVTSARGMEENKFARRKDGNVARIARMQLEELKNKKG